MAMSSVQEQAKTALVLFEKQCIGNATDAVDYEGWEKSREALLSQPILGKHLPTWVRTCRSGSGFRDKMKQVADQSVDGTWAKRRAFISEELNDCYAIISNGEDLPISDAVSRLKMRCSSELVNEAWAKITERRVSDPDGCITAARSLLESVCKYILDERSVAYTEKEDLPQLYKLVAKTLNLAPEQHQEDVFKQILGGCGTVIGGFASLRNKLGDAHGKSSRAVKPSPRHADLAINLSGSISTFLIETLEADK